MSKLPLFFAAAALAVDLMLLAAATRTNDAAAQITVASAQPTASLERPNVLNTLTDW